MPPVANFTANVVTGSTPLTVVFTDSSTNTPTSWSWDFGDGQTSTSQNPTHVYTSGGLYIVKLTATNGSGSNTLTRSDYINANGFFAFSWDLTDATDTPSVTVSSVGAGSATTIAGSAGWYREKRMAADEVGAGVTQSSTNTLDLKGSSHYSYPGVPQADGTASNPGNYVSTLNKPGGSTASAFWLFNVEFGTSSPTIEMRINSVSSDLFFHVRVNGKRISQQSSDFSVTAGSGYGIKLAFSSSKYRRITFHGLNNTQGRFGGVAVEAGYSVHKPTDAIRKTVAIIGDSYVNGVGGGAGGARSTETFAWKLATLLGAGNIIQAGIGGTGWGAMLSSDPTSTFSGRVSMVMAMNPDIIISAGGRSDSASGLQAAVESYIDSIGHNVEHYIVRTNATTSSTITSAIQTAASNKGVTFVNLDVDSYAKYSDGVSLTLAAHEQFAQDIYNVIKPYSPVPHDLWINGNLVSQVWINGNQQIIVSDV